MSFQDWVFWIIRIIAGLGGAFIGWLLTGPIVRVLYRVAFHKPLPNWTVAWLRVMGGILVGFLLYYYLPLGGGPGWGPGTGGGGSGPAKNGKGGDGQNNITNGKPPIKNGQPSKNGGAEIKDPESLAIELLRGPRYKGDERWYLIHGKEPAQTLAEVDEFLEKNRTKYKTLRIILRPDSPDEGNAPVRRLRDRADGPKYKLPSLIENAP